MVLVDIPGKEKKLYMDGYLYANLTTGAKVLKKDWDMIFLVDGPERSGKSVLAQQAAVIFDPNLSIERVCFTPKEFRQAVLTAAPYSAVIYDEAYTGLNSRAAMSQINRTLVSMLAEIGQRNLVIFVVMPTFFDLDKYVALWRSRALLHVYTGPDFERGYFSFYNVDNKKRLYVDGKKYYEYRHIKPNFYGRFSDGYMVDETAYRRKKRQSLTNSIEDQTQKEILQEVEAHLLDRVLSLGQDIPHKVKMELLGMKPATYYRRLSEHRQKELENGPTERTEIGSYPETEDETTDIDPNP